MSWLTYEDISKLTGVKQSTLRKWKQRGKMPPAFKIGWNTVWPDSLPVREWIDEKRTHVGSDQT